MEAIRQGFCDEAGQNLDQRHLSLENVVDAYGNFIRDFQTGRSHLACSNWHCGQPDWPADAIWPVTPDVRVRLTSGGAAPAVAEWAQMGCTEPFSSWPGSVDGQDLSLITGG
jgi:hypothetical protein